MMIRKDWIDIAKGVGILCVVGGHIFSGPLREAFFLFHMPLFFFLSGILFYPRANRRGFFTRKSIHLLIPYFSYLIIVFIPRFYHASLSVTTNTDYARDTLALMAIGGSDLKGTAGVFWFITCLFLTQQFVNLVCTTFLRKSAPILFPAMIVLGYINQIAYPHWKLAWAANVVLVSAPIFYLGWLWQTREIHSRWTILFPVFGLIAFGSVLLGAPLAVDMKLTNYGVPLLSLLAAACCILGIIQIARWWERIPIACLAFGLLGRTSMTILFLHLPVFVVMQDYLHIENSYLLFLFAVLIPLAAHWFFSKFRLTRILFLGSDADVQAVFQKHDPASSLEIPELHNGRMEPKSPPSQQQ
jgi:polysaccharide biosynthesis protein PslL